MGEDCAGVVLVQRASVVQLGSVMPGLLEGNMEILNLRICNILPLALQKKKKKVKARVLSAGVYYSELVLFCW